MKSWKFNSKGIIHVYILGRGEERNVFAWWRRPKILNLFIHRNAKRFSKQ